MAVRLRGALVLATAVILLLAVLLVATSGTVAAVVMCVAVLGLVVVVVFGVERAAFGALVLAFATAPMYRGLAGLTGDASTPTDMLALLAVVLLVPVVVSRPLELPPQYALGLLLVTVSGLVASLLSPLAIGSLFGLFRWLFFLGVLPIVIAWWRPPVKTVVTLLWAYILGHVASTAYALASGPTVGDRYQGLTHHTNAFGMAGLAAIAILIYLFAHHRGTSARVVVLGAGLVSAVSIVTSGSRAALLVAVVLVVLVPVFERSAGLGLAVLFLGVLALVMLPFVVESGSGGSALSRLTGDGTAVVADQARDRALDEGLRRFSESPVLGSGLAEVEYFHNIFLEVAVGAGLFGLFGFLIVMSVLTRPLLTRHVHRRLGYLPLAFIGLAPALPLIWDETMWVPISLAILATLGEEARGETPPVQAVAGVPARGLVPTGAHRP